MSKNERMSLAPVPCLDYICRKFYKKIGACKISNPGKTVITFRLIKPY